MTEPIRVGILGLSQREGRFNELGVRSWEESGCAEVQRCLLGPEDAETVFYLHRSIVLRGGQKPLYAVLREWCDAPDLPSRCELILTVAGCGLSARDTMPEATLPLLTRPLPHVAQFVRHASYATPHADAVLSRGVAGLRRQTLIINLPGPDPALLRVIMTTLTPLLPAMVAAVRQSPAR